jgi:hypothetical protein
MIEYKQFQDSRCFGIELEADPCLPLDSVSEIIRAVSIRPVWETGWKQSHSNEYWHVKTDSTCGNHLRHGIEVASFKASGNADIEHISTVALMLSVFGVQPNCRCGLHVHVDISDFNEIDAGILLARWLKIEEMMGSFIPFHRRYSCHCRPLRKRAKYSYHCCYSPIEIWAMFRPTVFSIHNNQQKKVMCNMVNYATCMWYESRDINKNIPFCHKSRKTVEFRFPEGSFHPEDVANWIRLLVMFVGESKKSQMPKTLKPVSRIEDFLEYFNLFQKGSFYILDKYLFELKKWLYKRLVLYGVNQFLREDAARKLRKMTNQFGLFSVV